MATTPKSTAPKAPRKPRVTKPKAAAPAAHKAPVKRVAHPKPAAAEQAAEVATPVVTHKPSIQKDRYVFATGRRKTAVANVRLFSGQGEIIVNKKNFTAYFPYTFYQEEILKPFQLTGLEKDYYFTAHVNGGGPHAQAGALRHGIATALAQLSEDVRKILKKNSLLTRDDRKKERKKPGLKRARRSPQWAKR